MPKTRKQKEEIIDELRELLKKQRLMVFFTFRGLKMEEFSDLRSKVKDNDSLIRVAKKTLFKLATQKEKITIPDDYFSVKDQFAVLFGISDNLASLKVLDKISRTQEGMKIIGGSFEKKILSPQEVIELSRIPSRNELFSKIVWLLSYPQQSFVSILKGNIRNLILLLSAKVQKGQSS